MEEDSIRIQLDDDETGPMDRKNKKRTIKNSSESRAIWPVINPLTKSNAGELFRIEPEAEVS